MVGCEAAHSVAFLGSDFLDRRGRHESWARAMSVGSAAISHNTTASVLIASV